MGGVYTIGFVWAADEALSIELDVVSRMTALSFFPWAPSVPSGCEVLSEVDESVAAVGNAAALKLADMFRRRPMSNEVAAMRAAMGAGAKKWLAGWLAGSETKVVQNAAHCSIL